MFTGIVEEVGKVTRVEMRAGGMRVQVKASTVLEGTKPGDSILVDGICLTVEDLSDQMFRAFLSAETLTKTTFGDVKTGRMVNLERSLALGDRLGGHLVSGHVEARGRIRDLNKDGETYLLTVSVPGEFAPYVAPKGSVSVDGVSLTIAEGTQGAFTVSLIPETFEKTTFPLKTTGDFVNLEPDLILKYVMSVIRNLTAEAKGGSITIDKLLESGFITD